MVSCARGSVLRTRRSSSGAAPALARQLCDVMPRILIPVLFVLAIDAYGAFALRPLVETSAHRTLWRGLWWGLSALTLVVIALAATGITRAWPKPVQTLLPALLFVLYLGKLAGVSVFVLDDLRRLLQAGYRALAGTTAETFWPTRSRFLTQLGIVVGTLPVVTLTYGMVRNPYRYQVREVDIPIRGLPERLAGLRIVQLSDIHSGSFYRTSPLREATALVNDLGADLLCFTGDLVNSDAREIEPYIDIFAAMEARLGRFSTIGNHDYGEYVAGWGPAEKEANWQRLYANHRRLGWDLLLNANRVVDVDGEPLAIVGVENWSALPRFPRTGDLALASRGTEAIATKILLSHDPTHWDAQVAPHRPDIALQLAGHTHGFQFGVEVPGMRWSPSQYVYEQWAGLYTRGAQHLYVNRGFGFLGYPGRVGILPEIAVIRLVAA